MEESEDYLVHKGYQVLEVHLLVHLAELQVALFVEEEFQRIETIAIKIGCSNHQITKEVFRVLSDLRC